MNLIRGLPASLAAPSHRHARSGRMNADGISVFYGALDVDTCIAEVRAPVGSNVVVGKFIPLRPIKVVDLNRLQNIYVEGSYFDPGHIVELSRARFLERLVGELSSPVLPGNEEREYLPTQVVAEYLAQIDGLDLDGVMFKSSQVSGNGQNIVLFNHAACVESADLPEGTEVDVHFGLYDPDDNDLTIAVRERVPPENEEQGSPSPSPAQMIFSSPSGHDEILVDADDDCPHGPTLRLEIASVEVHEIQGVKYEGALRHVHRHRSVKNDT